MTKIKVFKAMTPVIEKEAIEITLPFFYKEKEYPNANIMVYIQGDEIKTIGVSAGNSGWVHYYGPSDFKSLPMGYTEITAAEFGDQVQKVINGIENALKLI